MMDEKERKPFVNRFWVMTIIVSMVFLVLGFNLWRLQIAKGSYYSAMAKGNFMQEVTLTPTRGDITDKHGKLLATSVPQFALMLDWLDLQQTQNENWKDVVRRLAVFVKPYWPNQAESTESIAEDIFVMIQNHQWERYKPVVIIKNVKPSLRAVIAEHQEELPGVSVEALPVRYYPEGTLAGQLLGYVREISDAEIDRFNQNPDAERDGFKYQQGDLVGKMGVENSYDYLLRGKEGVQQVEVDNNARPISKKVVNPPVPGRTIQLTIDADLQKAIENKLDDIIKEIQKESQDAKAGAAVVIDVNTGKILAMASRPAMNPNDLTGIISEKMAEKYFTSKDAASFNRALSGLFPPGSTYKMLTAMAALEAGVVTDKEVIDDRITSLGSRNAQSQGFREWGNNYFGLVNVYKALAKSSDIYFEVVGRRVFDKEPELVRQLSHEFGLGVQSGVDLPGEAKGNAPSPEWKKSYFTPYYEKLLKNKPETMTSDYAKKIAVAKFNTEWHLFDSFNNAIGQGDNSYTPLQLANYVATIVNGGKHYRPYIVDKIIDPVTGKVVQENQPQIINRVSVSPETLEIVKKGMQEVTSPGGTASFLFAQIPEFSGGGKTGTAQLGSKGTAGENLFNGMFVAFAPYDHPQIAFAGVVAYAGHGGSSAGYVAKEAFMKYFGWKSTNGG